MTWDLGLRGLVVLAAIAIGFGLLAGVLAGHGWKGRAWTAVVAAVACFVVGLLTSEVLFGWATEEDLQPNVDGLSRDEVLLSSLLTTVVAVAASRRPLRHHGTRPGASSGRDEMVSSANSQAAASSASSARLASSPPR